MTYTPDQNELGDMLRYTRPAGSAADLAFKQKFLTPLGVVWDSRGNGFIQIDRKPILWSSHTDTVHSTSGRQDVRMKSCADKHMAYSTGKGCLGADCTTGVFIMMNMIRNKVPGMYVFHYGEERGCIGSKFIADHHAETLKTYRAAIAFDRKGYTDIVEYQSGSRCCSKAFAASLAKLLDRGYSASSGVYTDTAEYVDYIGECTNISVGYFNQHTASESQDVDFALWLADRMCKVDFSDLTYERKAGDYESEYTYSGHHYGYGRYEPYKEPKTMYGLVNQSPWAVARMLEEQGFTFHEVQEYIDNFYTPRKKVKAL